MDSEVQYDGEYVLTKLGNKDFGEISVDIAKIIKRESGKIRLRIGKEEKDQRGNFGEKHIERPARLAQLKSAGFENARDFVEFISSDYDAIYKGTGSSLIICKKTILRNILYVALEAVADGDYYDVKSCLVSRGDYLKNKTPLWVKPAGGA